MKQEHPISIHELNTLIKAHIESASPLSSIWIHGEISQFNFYKKGRMAYLTLSDDTAHIQCVMYETALNKLAFTPTVGSAVYALGKCTFFSKKGQLNMQLHTLTMTGPGTRSKAFDILKEALLNEGLFDLERKKAIPRFPSHIGVITAHQSAAMWDIVEHIHASAPHIHITIIPAVVQGASAVASLITALRQAAFVDTLDCLVIARGGGSAEDLSCFNAEELVREIAICPIPIISAIGHETDTSLTDLVADLRQATPTAAAKYIIEPLVIFHEIVQSTLPGIGQRLKAKISYTHSRINDRLNNTYHHLKNLYALKHQQLVLQMKRLESSNPLKKFRQGFSITTIGSKTIIKSVSQVQKGESISVYVGDGTIEAKVTNYDNSKRF